MTARSNAPKDRAAYLRVLCARDEELRREVESLLRSHEQSDEFLETPAAQLSQIVSATCTRRHQRISRTATASDPIEFERRIGRGGMGSVWLATRFDNEYQEAGRHQDGQARHGHAGNPAPLPHRAPGARGLDHPNIAA